MRRGEERRGGEGERKNTQTLTKFAQRGSYLDDMFSINPIRADIFFPLISFVLNMLLVGKSLSFRVPSTAARVRGNIDQSGRLAAQRVLNMKLQTGIVGLPNVGKSTLFNALVGSEAAQAANFPFCTIEPNVGIVNVPDPRLEKLAEIHNSEKVIAATMEFVDIAGIVKGASAGEGLGNKFLSNIRQTDAIVHVVRLLNHMFHFWSFCEENFLPYIYHIYLFTLF